MPPLDCPVTAALVSGLLRHLFVINYTLASISEGNIPVNN